MPDQEQVDSAAHVAKKAGRDSATLTIEGVGTIDLPSKADLVYVAGIGTLAALGLIEWPLAAILGIGHVLSQSKRNKTLREFGEALGEA